MRISEIQVSYSSTNKDKPQIRSSKDSYALLMENWNKDTIELYEEFQILLLNRANRVLGIYHLSKGGVSGTVVDAKIVFSVALKCCASVIILAHNHPSGNLYPSRADLEITKKLKKGGELLEISVLDHIIISDNGYYSFADEGQM